jgi:endo-alpha-N-acetylgalactosaminidase
LPQNLRFQPGRKYSVSFTYEASAANEYGFVTSSGGQSTTRLAAAHTPTKFTATIDGSPGGDAWIGLTKLTEGTQNEDHDLILDDLVVDDIGVADPVITRIPQSQLSVKYADSAETAGENGAAANVLDGDPATLWHTQWSGVPAPMPHEIQLDLGQSTSVRCLYYLPRQSQHNGRIAGYEVYTSADGTNWGSPAAAGTWADTPDEEAACFPARDARYVRLRATSEVAGGVWTSAAELNVGR